jgi:hypothetical protein
MCVHRIKEIVLFVFRTKFNQENLMNLFLFLNLFWFMVFYTFSRSGCAAPAAATLKWMGTREHSNCKKILKSEIFCEFSVRPSVRLREIYFENSGVRFTALLIFLFLNCSLRTIEHLRALYLTKKSLNKISKINNKNSYLILKNCLTYLNWVWSRCLLSLWCFHWLALLSMPLLSMLLWCHLLIVVNVTMTFF